MRWRRRRFQRARRKARQEEARVEECYAFARRIEHEWSATAPRDRGKQLLFAHRYSADPEDLKRVHRMPLTDRWSSQAQSGPSIDPQNYTLQGPAGLTPSTPPRR